MEAVDQTQVDQIVVYKIDRLTRSLADFSKILDRLDSADASFVSVTQSFNTATSMGRLTLNVLLSFAQFEREVTAERIRDKIAALKRKGLWMGSNVPLGYNPDGRTLKINEFEAKTVRRVYALYEEPRSVSQVREVAEEEGLRSKRSARPDGTPRGGSVMSRGHIHHILSNPIYAGRIRHKGKVFEGQHEALIEPDRWDTAQTLLLEKAPNTCSSVTSSQTASPLIGKLFDEAGERLTPSHTKKAAKRYRYYVSRHKIKGRKRVGPGSGWRIPAAQLEEIIKLAVHTRLEARAQKVAPHEVFDPWAIDPFKKIKRVQLSDGQIEVELTDMSDTKLTLPFTMRRRGVETKLINADQARDPDAKLIANIACAVQWFELLKGGSSFDQIAAKANTSKRRVQQMMSLAFLAPDIVRDVLNGRQPIGFTSDWCLRHDIPSDWQAQRDLISHL